MDKKTPSESEKKKKKWTLRTWSNNSEGNNPRNINKNKVIFRVSTVEYMNVESGAWRESCGIIAIAIVIVADKYRFIRFYVYFFSFGLFFSLSVSACAVWLCVFRCFFLHTNSCICPELYSEYNDLVFFSFRTVIMSFLSALLICRAIIHIHLPWPLFQLSFCILKVFFCLLWPLISMVCLYFGAQLLFLLQI